MAIGMGTALGIIGGAQAAKSIAESAALLDPMNPEQRARLKELERQEALGLLGLSAGEEQRLTNMQLQPVRATQRQAMDEFAQGQQIADVGQGAAFRQQQALQEAQGRVMQQAAQEAQMQVQELDQIAEARELARLDRLRKQRQKNQAAIAGMFGGIAEGVGMAADVFVFNEQQKQFEEMLLGANKKANEAIAKKNAGGVTSISGDYSSALAMGDENEGAVRAVADLPQIDFSQRGQRPVFMGTPLPQITAADEIEQIALERAMEPNVMMPSRMRTGRPVFMGSPLPLQATTEISRLLPQRSIYGQDFHEQFDLSQDIVDIGWGTAQVIRDPRTEKPIKVKVITPDNFERRYFPGEEGWTTIMSDLAKAGWGRGGL